VRDSRQALSIMTDVSRTDFGTGTSDESDTRAPRPALGTLLVQYSQEPHRDSQRSQRCQHHKTIEIARDNREVTRGSDLRCQSAAPRRPENSSVRLQAQSLHEATEMSRRRRLSIAYWRAEDNLLNAFGLCTSRTERSQCVFRGRRDLPLEPTLDA
jgi:hypothetical protein